MTISVATVFESYGSPPPLQPSAAVFAKTEQRREEEEESESDSQESVAQMEEREREREES